jgi:hypothetical protein
MLKARGVEEDSMAPPRVLEGAQDQCRSTVKDDRSVDARQLRERRGTRDDRNFMEGPLLRGTRTTQSGWGCRSRLDVRLDDPGGWHGSDLRSLREVLFILSNGDIPDRHRRGAMLPRSTAHGSR